MRRTLNPAQQLAVYTTEGPVLVIAGPGTGKTEILASRISNILANPEIKPENILCLSYTEAGTVAMRQRLIEFIGTDAYQVDVMTFHSFCSRVIQEQSDHFGHRGLSAASDLDRYQIACEIIDSFPQDHPLVRETGEIYYEASRLLELYSVMKGEGWTPAHLIDRCKEQIDAFEEDSDIIYKRAGRNKNGSEYKKGDKNQIKLNEAIKKLWQFAAGANTFSLYQRKLAARKLYDFSDMILWVAKVFTSSPEILAEYQDRYTHLLVDEFQDTSGSQFDLLIQLVSYSDCPNVFAVGDDDQSIYRFQGASVENLRRYQERFGDALTTIALTENHRSSQNILDAAGSLIGRNVERLAVDKELKAVNADVCSIEELAQLRQYGTTAQETAAVAGKIIELKESGIPLSRIAVLYRNHFQSDDIIRYLEGQGVSVVTRKRANTLQEPLIINLLGIFQYLACEMRRPHSGEAFLFKLLHEKAFGISPLTLAEFSADMSTAAIKGENPFWRDNLQKAEELSAAGQVIESLIAAAVTMPLRELLHFVIAETGILTRALAGTDQMWNLQLLNTLIDFVRSEGEKQKLDLAGLLALVADMTAQGIALPIEKLTGSGDGVNFVTAHGSKGLEFDHVFMIGCTSKVWDAAPRNRTYTLPSTVFKSVLGSEEEEARRLFYVGMTRAKRSLSISFSGKDNNDKALERSRFVAELVESGLVVAEVSVSGQDLVSFGQTVLAPLPKRSSIFDDAFVDELMKSYRLSVSHLSAYLRCPTEFYFTRLLHAPGKSSLASVFGLAVHAALEFAFKTMAADAEKAFPSVEEFMQVFRAYMSERERDFTPTEYRRRMEYAENILPLFYGINVGRWSKLSLAEVSIRAEISGVPVGGKLDRVELLNTSGLVDIVDDKSGNYLYGKKKLQCPDPEKVTKLLSEGKSPSFEAEFGGDYWRQAVFYKILAEADRSRGWNVNQVRFEFIEPDKITGEFHQDVVEVGQGDVEVVQVQITEVYGKIRNKEFAKGCGDPDCEWCAFVARLEKAAPGEDTFGYQEDLLAA